MNEEETSSASEQPSGSSRWMDRALEGTHHHYLFSLPVQKRSMTGWLLRLFYSGIRIPENQTAIIENLPGDAVVVYASKYRSYFEYLFYHTRYQQLGLPVPEIGLGYRFLLLQPFTRVIRAVMAKLDHLVRFRKLPDPYAGHYLHDAMASNTAIMLSLVEKKGFRGRFLKSKPDPLRRLIEIQQDLDRPIYIVPQLMFFGKNPKRAIPSFFDILFGPEHKPGITRRILTLFQKPGKIVVEVSEPLNLRQYLATAEAPSASSEALSALLRQKLLIQVNRHRQSIIGPTLRSREELRERILTGSQLSRFLREHADKSDTPLYQVRKQVDGYLDEIAAKYNIGVIKLCDIVLRWVFNTIFEGISLDRDGLNRIKSVSQKGPLILIPSHKSHIDYLILSYLLYNANMHCPLIAAGKNLSFWPLGPIFRGGGAFFIRRTFKGQQLYARVFSQYVHTVLEEGYNIEFFIEGGRSRTGKMILPKLGLLSIIIEAFQRGACEDLNICPVYIGYDRVLEESAYLHELEGGKKESENLKQVIRARKFLKNRYGRIYIRFHEPISFRRLLEDNGIQLDALNPPEQAALVRNLGHRVINAINDVTVVTPHAVVAGAFLNCAKKRISHEHLTFHIDTYMTCLNAMGVTLADSLIMDATGAIQQALDSYAQRKIIERFSLGADSSEEDIVYAVIENKRPNLEYYKNNCIAFFIPPAFTALAILELDAFQFDAADLHDTYGFLQDLFKNEFAFDVDMNIEQYIRKNLKLFTDDAILMPHPHLPDTYNLTSNGFRKIKLFAAFLATYVESYWIVLNYFRKASKKDLQSKDRLKKIESLGNKMYKNEEIERKEALSKVNYQNALDYFISRGITGSENTDTIDHYMTTLQRYLTLLPR